MREKWVLGQQCDKKGLDGISCLISERALSASSLVSLCLAKNCPYVLAELAAQAQLVDVNKYSFIDGCLVYKKTGKRVVTENRT